MTLSCLCLLFVRPFSHFGPEWGHGPPQGIIFTSLLSLWELFHMDFCCLAQGNRPHSCSKKGQRIPPCFGAKARYIGGARTKERAPKSARQRAPALERVARWQKSSPVEKNTAAHIWPLGRLIKNLSHRSEECRKQWMVSLRLLEWRLVAVKKFF